MDTYRATEVAYKNGYAAGAEECASRLRLLISSSNATIDEGAINEVLIEILQNGKNDASSIRENKRR